MNTLTKFYGIGDVLASKLYAKLMDRNLIKPDTTYTIPQMRRILSRIRDDLPVITQADIKYKPIKKIPRSEIDRISQFFPDCTIAGSYRREKPFSSDIDIICYRPVAEIGLPPGSIRVSEGPAKIVSFIRLDKHYYKADIFSCTGNRAFMLLYATGSGIFNLRMRKLAKDRGYLLNQYGIYSVSSPGKNLLDAKSERDIFDFLRIRYLHPRDRTDDAKFVAISKI